MLACRFFFDVLCRSDPAFQPIKLTVVIGCVWKHQIGEDDINWDVFARHLDEVEVYGADGVEMRAKEEGFAVVRLYQQATAKPSLVQSEYTC